MKNSTPNPIFSLFRLLVSSSVCSAYKLRFDLHSDYLVINSYYNGHLKQNITIGHQDANVQRYSSLKQFKHEEILCSLYIFLDRLTLSHIES